jgi:hypothetical protein
VSIHDLIKKQILSANKIRAELISQNTRRRNLTTLKVPFGMGQKLH